MNPRGLLSLDGSWIWILKIVLLGLFVTLTNLPIISKFGDLDTWNLARHLAVWAISLLALTAAALQPRLAFRAFWSSVLSLSTAVSYAFLRASGDELTLSDAVIFWFARNEAYRASVFYREATIAFGVVLVAGLAVMLLPPYPRSPRLRTWLQRARWLPVAPIVIVAGFGFWKGRVPILMPVQFAPAGIAVVATPKILRLDSAERDPVVWQPQLGLKPNIVLLVDESVRRDYVDFSPGNPYTPRLAARRDLLVDFGPAAAASNCSLQTNAILRFMAERRRLTETLKTSPTVWRYAKKAGYRTIFIDAQTFLTRRGKLYLQHAMQYEELASIDAFYTMEGSTEYKDADFELLDYLARGLSANTPVFIYANKIGAHIPYDGNYPSTERVFRPTLTDTGEDSRAARINSYRNNLRWTVDIFFERLFAEIETQNLVLIYTSDHGQIFEPGRVTHCATATTSDPRMALVPLFVLAEAPALRERFASGAASNYGRASQFQIAPTLLELMGYQPVDFYNVYEATLFDSPLQNIAYLSGDPFKLFSPNLDWRPIDLSRVYLEPDP